MENDSESVLVEYRNRIVGEFLDEAIAEVSVNGHRELLEKVVDRVIADMAVHLSHDK